MRASGWLRNNRTENMDIRYRESLAGHTGLRVGGPAAVFAVPEKTSEVIRLIREARKSKRPFFILGRGSNLLVRDEGFDGLVISTSRLRRILPAGDYFECESGVTLPQILGFGLRTGRGGLEFLAGIPGSLGGALVMNAGTEAGTIGAVVRWVKVLDRNLRIIALKSSELSFGYRCSSLGGYPFIVAAALKTGAVSCEESRQLINTSIRRRRERQPVGFACAGSIFRNPENDYAGRLIEAAGCKGWREGAALVSSRHANFIVNTGNAEASDVLRLMERVRDRVREKFAVTLAPEVKIL